MMGETEAVVEIDYDGVISRKVHPISITVVDRDGNRGGTRFDLWERSRQHLATFELGEEVHGVVFVPGGTTLASGSAEGVELWDLKTRTGTTTSLGGDVTAVALSAGGGTLASGSSIGQIQLLDLEGGRVTATFSGATHKVRSLAFSSDGAILASGGPQGIQLWDVETRTSTVTLPGGVTSVAFSPNGSALATGAADGVRVWDVETEAEVATYRHGRGRGGRGVNSVAFSPDGTLVASGGDDTTVRLWEVATGDSVAVLEGHGEPVRSLAFSPDGTMLATGGPDLAVNLWDPVSRERLAELRGGGRGANALAFSPDGATLAAGTEDQIGLWDLSDWVRPRLRRLVLVSGDDQQGTSGEPLAAPLVVEARDQYDNPLPGVEVTFLVTEGDGRLGEKFTQEGRITDANGRTEVLFTLGPNPGANAVAAEVPGLHRVIFGAIGIEGSQVPGVEAEVSTWQLPDGAILRVGKGRVRSHDRTVAFSSDGRSLAVLSWVGLWLYDVATSRPRALVVEPPGESIGCMAFSPDGTTIATGGDGPIRLWEVATGIGTAALEGHPGGVRSLAFLTDGTLAAAGSGHFSSWDVATGTMLGVTTLVLGNRSAFWFSPDGSVLAATGGYSNTTIRLWDPATGTGTAKLTGHKRDIGSLAFSPDGSMLASGSSDHTVKLWDVAAAANVATLEGHTSGVGCVAFAPDGRTLAAGSPDGTVRLWDPATATLLSTFRGGAEVASVAFSPDGRTVASVPLDSHDGTVMFWDVASGNAAAFAGGHRGWVGSVALSPDGTTLAAAFDGGEIELWDMMTGSMAVTLEGHALWNNCVAFSPDGTTLASGGSDRTVKLWEVTTGENKATWESRGDRSWVSVVTFSPDGTMIASGHGNGTVKVWEVATGANTATFEADYPDAVASVAFSPNGSILATGNSDGTFRVWDLAAGTPILQEKIGSDIFAVTFSPDGTALAQASHGRLGSIWTVPPGDDVATPSVEYSSWVSTAALSPDGSILLLGSLTRYSVPVIEVRDVATGSPIATLDGNGDVGSLAFTRDGSIFASGSRDGTILVWDLGRILPHPRSLTKLSGDGQAAEPGEHLAEPLVVSVRDQNGAAYPGAAVTFAILGEGGTLTAATDTTDAEGRAATTLAVGEEPGAYTVVATVADLEPVTFTATAKANPDFDGDGEVGFSDFFLFAEAFGGDGPRFDLDGSGSVDFSDFFLFVEQFGQPARAKLVAMARELIGLPDGPGLQQNAPNPFNSQTVIPWFLLEAGPARLEVFALTGQRVAVLHAGPQQAGFHRYGWDGCDARGRALASGVYVYRLVTAEGVQTRKLTLLR